MKLIIYITSYLLFISGAIICIGGMFSILGLAELFSGIFSRSPQTDFLTVSISFYSLIVGGKVFVEGLLVIAVSQIEILLVDIASKE